MSAVTSPLAGPSGRRVVVALLLAACLVLAGCSAIGDDGGLPAGETAAERFLSLDGYSGTVEITYSGPVDADNRTVDITVRPSTAESRIEIREPAPKAGNVVVYNRTHIVRYNASENEVRRITLEGRNRTAHIRERLRRFVDRVRGESEAGRAGVSPLPVVPGVGAGPGNATNATRLEYSYGGTETVLGRPAHVVRMRPANGTDTGIVTQTVWIDAEWFVTLKAHSVRQFDDERVSYSFRFRNITFDPDISGETFTFDPPPGASVDESASLRQSTYDSRAELAAATDVSVPDPDLPEGFRLERARLRVGEETRELRLSYRRGTNFLSIEKVPLGSDDGTHEGERVAIGNRTGRYEAFGTGAGVTWTCDGYRYTVSGGLEKATLVAVAESMVCE